MKCDLTNRRLKSHHDPICVTEMEKDTPRHSHLGERVRLFAFRVFYSVL